LLWRVKKDEWFSKNNSRRSISPPYDYRHELVSRLFTLYKSKKPVHQGYTNRLKKIAAIIEVFLRAGVDAIMGKIEEDLTWNAVKEAEDRTGVKCIIVSTPAIPVTPRTLVDGFDMNEV